MRFLIGTFAYWEMIPTFKHLPKVTWRSDPPTTCILTAELSYTQRIHAVKMKRAHISFCRWFRLIRQAFPRAMSTSTWTLFFTAKHALRKENICLAYRALPDTYEVAYIKTGQLNSERTSHSWIAHYYSPPFRDRLLAEAGEPIIRSDYDIYLHQENAGESAGQPNRLRLLYFKPGCSQDDSGTRFFMQVIPRSAEDLPDQSKEAGYEELNFAPRGLRR